MKAQNLIHILIGIVCLRSFTTDASRHSRSGRRLSRAEHSGGPKCPFASRRRHLQHGRLGWSSLGFNVTGDFNTATGAATLLNNTADQNTATGAGALLSNTTGGFNTANGAFALLDNTIGGFNTATGASALQANTTGSQNTADGMNALLTTRPARFNTATGFRIARLATPPARTIPPLVSMRSFNSTGNQNTATGEKALLNNTTGASNTAHWFRGAR